MCWPVLIEDGLIIEKETQETKKKGKKGKSERFRGYIMSIYLKVKVMKGQKVYTFL